MKAASSISRIAASGLVVWLCTGNTATAQLPPAALPPQPLSWFGDPGSPNISGVWARAEGAANGATGDGNAASPEGWIPWPPPLRGEFAALWKKRVADAKAGKRADDPVVACLPAGIPRFITGMKGPLLIVQTPGRVSMTRDYGPPRRIWLDARQMPTAESLEQFFAGNSRGRYERDSLFIETIGLKDQPIDATGIPHSDKAVVEERYRRLDSSTLSVEVVVRDELALRKPLHTVVTYKAVTDPRWELRDLTCVPKDGYHPELFVH